jgi:hypothetical protein
MEIYSIKMRGQKNQAEDSIRQTRLTQVGEKFTMSELGTDTLRREIQQQYSRVAALRRAVYAQPDPSAADELTRLLSEAEIALADLESQGKVKALEVKPGAGPVSLPKGRMLGPDTTKLDVKPTLNMQPLPTGVYHLLDPETDPLVTLSLENLSRDPKRVCVKTYLEGLSAQDVRTVEIKRNEKLILKLLPTLFPERARAITEVQRATLHVLVEDLDGKPESHDTYPIVCLARTASFNAVRRPGSGEVVDLSHYYGAWVTPHAEAVQERIRRAVDLLPDRQIWGYQGDPDGVDRQVAALYQSLREWGIAYVNSVIDYGGKVGEATQRTRLPRESIAGRAANCIDGAVLFASLLEGSSLSAALVLVPGHAFVGWEVWDGSDEWKYLETTMIGSQEFEAACKSGMKQFSDAEKFGRSRLVVHKLYDLRARGIWPME